MAVCVGAIAWPVVAHAQQQTALPVVGFLNSASAGGYGVMAAAFKQGLRKTGYVDGDNVVIESPSHLRCSSAPTR